MLPPSLITLVLGAGFLLLGETSSTMVSAPSAEALARSTKHEAPGIQSVDATIARAQSAWSKVRTLRATFEQTVTNPITGSTLTSSGELQQRKPNRLAITFKDPAGDRIVADGKFVWVFLQSATPGQVMKLANTDAGAASTDLIGQFLNTPRRKYDATDAGSDKVGTRAARALVLTAKPGQALPFVRAKVWVDAKDGLIRQFESTDANGLTRRVRLLTLSPNATVADSAFVFRVPRDVRIVSR
jgi:outer membrane lipoprotein carrier protein